MTVELSATKQVALPAQQLLEVIGDIERYPAWVRWVGDVTVRDRDEQGRVAAARITVRTPMGAVGAELAFTHDKAAVSCRLLSSELLSRFDAAYTVTGQDEASVLDAELVVATTMSLVPASMIRSYGEGLLSELLDAVEAEGVARWRPPHGTGTDGTR